MMNRAPMFSKACWTNVRLVVSYGKKEFRTQTVRKTHAAPFPVPFWPSQFLTSLRCRVPSSVHPSFLHLHVPPLPRTLHIALTPSCSPSSLPLSDLFPPLFPPQSLLRLKHRSSALVRTSSLHHLLSLPTLRLIRQIAPTVSWRAFSSWDARTGEAWHRSYGATNGYA